MKPSAWTQERPSRRLNEDRGREGKEGEDAMSGQEEASRDEPEVVGSALTSAGSGRRPRGPACCFSLSHVRPDSTCRARHSSRRARGHASPRVPGVSPDYVQQAETRESLGKLFGRMTAPVHEPHV